MTGGLAPDTGLLAALGAWPMPVRPAWSRTFDPGARGRNPTLDMAFERRRAARL